MMAGVPEPFRHSVRVRYSECDLQGIVFNANYLTYVDDALTELWRAAVPGGYTGMVESGVDMVVGEANIRYLAPARVDDLLDLDVSVARLGTTGMTLEVAIGCEGRVADRGDDAVRVRGRRATAARCRSRTRSGPCSARK